MRLDLRNVNNPVLCYIAVKMYAETLVVYLRAHEHPFPNQVSHNELNMPSSALYTL